MRKTQGFFGKNLFTVACGVDGHVCVLQFLGTFSFSWLVCCGKKTHRCTEKNLSSLRHLWNMWSLFSDRLVSGRPFDACRGMWPFLRLRSAANLGKNPPWGKTFVVIRKNPWPFGKTCIGKNLEKPILCFKKDLFRKTHSFVMGGRNL